MKASALAGLTAAAAFAVVVSGCGSDSKNASGGAGSGSSSPGTATTSAPAAELRPTIADYVKENGITETPVKGDDPGAPKIDLPVPVGWKALEGQDAPDWAYRVITDDGSGAGDDPADITAVLSKLTGQVDPQAILGAAAGELENLPGFTPTDAGTASPLGKYPGYQLGGTWMKDGVTRVIAQKTVVIPGAGGVYVLQINSDGPEPTKASLGAATATADRDTTITT